MRSSSSGRRWPSPSGCAIFAVAATLATQAFCTPAAAVGGIYGVLMLIAGAIVAAAFQLRGPP
jgi:hypothetical protein